MLVTRRIKEEGVCTSREEFEAHKNNIELGCNYIESYTCYICRNGISEMYYEFEITYVPKEVK